MKKLSNNLFKVLMVSIILTLSIDVHAQLNKKNKSDNLKRPNKVGHAATDEYVTSSFNLYEKNQKIAKKLADAKGNAQDADKVKSDLEKQKEEAASLLAKSETLLKEVKNISPKTKSLKAAKAIKAATKALNATQKAIPEQLEMIKTQSGHK